MINFKTIIRIIGILLLLETVMFLVMFGRVLLLQRKRYARFLESRRHHSRGRLIAGSSGKGGERQLTRRDGYVLVSFAWVAFSLFGMLPFYIGGYIPDIAECILRNHVRFQQYGCHRAWTTSSRFLMEYCSGAV